MQTFLPHADFELSARVLDSRRLNKQRVECKQIVKALTGPEYGWQNHPAVKMWRGHLGSLIYYALEVCRECDRRGIADNVDQKAWFRRRLAELGKRSREVAGPLEPIGLSEPPPWLGDPDFHASHRSNLKRKDPEHYVYDGLPDDIAYVWPVP